MATNNFKSNDSCYQTFVKPVLPTQVKKSSATLKQTLSSLLSTNSRKLSVEQKIKM